VLRMFELPSEPTKPEDLVITSITRSQNAGSGRTGAIVITDGTGSFYQSRTLFQMLHDFGRYASIVALSESNAEAKKSLMTRAGRYSGLLDVLTFQDEPTPAFDGADSWLAISPDETTLNAQIDAASAAGVSRIFLLLSAALDDAESIESRLASTGMEYTVMRTGPLVDSPGGSGLKLGALDMPVCEDVPREDVFRFVTEALTLPEASKRAFSLCPSEGVASTLKQMRLCGYERREEVQLLLAGVIREQDADASEMSDEEKEAEAELVLRSEAEVAAEREEELKMLLEKARQRGVETQARLEFEEAEKAAKRKEMEKYYKAPPDTDGGADDTPVEIPDTPPAPPSE
jgi:hypothetical protein